MGNAILGGGGHQDSSLMSNPHIMNSDDRKYGSNNTNIINSM